MKKIKYGDLIAIHRVMEGIMDKNIPISIGHKIQRNFKKIDETVKEFDQSRLRLVDKYAYKDEVGKPVVRGNKYDLKDTQAFDDEYNDLLNTEIALVFDNISFTALEKMEESGRYDSLTPREQAVLEFMIEEETE